jgi:plastocyanin
MTMRRKILIALLAVVMLAGVALLPLVAKSRASADPREIALVARGMSFYLADGPAIPNPTLMVLPGERVRFVLQNVDPGLNHNFAVKDWDLTMDEIKGEGVAAIEVTIPETAGRYEYTCTPHAVMMKGTIEVRAGQSR